AVFVPAWARELHPLHFVVELLAGGHFHYFVGVPVRAAARRAIGYIFGILVESHSREGYGAVVREFVRVEKYRWLALQGVLHVEHALVLQTVVFVEVVFAAFFKRSAILRVVPDFGEALFYL